MRARVTMATMGLLAACTGPDVDGWVYACEGDEDCGAGWFCADDGYCAERAEAPPEPWEICEDCLDNDGDGDTDEATCAERRPLVLTAPAEALPAGYAVSLTFDHAALVADGASQASGDDVRVVWRDPDSGALSERERIADPTAGWDQAATRLWFALADPLVADEETGDYYLYWHAPGDVVHADAGAVFSWADLFARPDADALGKPWVEHEKAGAVALVRGALAFTATNTTGPGPAAAALLPKALTRGRWLVHLGFDWSAPSDEDFAVWMHLGTRRSLVDAAPTATTIGDGVVAGLVWQRTLLRVAELRLLTAAGSEPLGDLSGAHALALALDLDARTATASVDGGRPSAAFALPGKGDVEALRLMSDRLTLPAIVRAQGFTEVWVRRLPAGTAEPTIVVEDKEDACDE